MPFAIGQYPAMRKLSLLILMTAFVALALSACKEGDGAGFKLDSDVETEWRTLEWQGLIDFVGSEINFYIADEGVTEAPDRLRTAKVDEHGQASYSGNLPAVTTDEATIFYYIDANDDGGCTTLYWEPSGVHVIPGDDSTAVILWGIEGNDRDMKCEGFQP